MPASIFIFNRLLKTAHLLRLHISLRRPGEAQARQKAAASDLGRFEQPLFIAAILFFLVGLSARPAFAEGTPPANHVPNDEEFTNTPFTEYGSFNEDEEEAAEEQFLQYGRLFGVSLGIGMDGALGNRGQLWTGGFPLIDAKVYYWYDFHLALALAFSMVSHSYPLNATTTATATTVDVNLTHLGIQLRYYFDVKNMGAAITFINPYIFGGLGALYKTETAENSQGTSVSDTAFALEAGLGMEFVLSPKKTYFQVEGLIRNASFKDSNTTVDNIGPLGTLYYAATANVLFTW